MRLLDELAFPAQRLFDNDEAALCIFACLPGRESPTMFAFIARLRQGMRRLRETHMERIETQEGGVRVVTRRGQTRLSFAWDDVTRISIFKRDLGVVDDVRLAFNTREEYFEFSEETDGFKQLAEKMCEVFPTIPGDWFCAVVLPPFATNERVLYERADQSRDPREQ